MNYTVRGILQARILEWVAFPFSRGSSQPRDQTQVSHIAGGFFTSCATGKPKNTGVVAYPFSRRSSRPKNWTGVSCIAGRFFTNWTISGKPKGKVKMLIYWSLDVKGLYLCSCSHIVHQCFLAAKVKEWLQRILLYPVESTDTMSSVNEYWLWVLLIHST